jgi:hypothetical protein
MSSKKEPAMSGKKKKKKVVYIIMMMGSPFPDAGVPFPESDKKEEGNNKGEVG